LASVISAGTTSGTALNMTADTSGQLQLATGASPTTAISIDSSQNVTLNNVIPSNSTAPTNGMFLPAANTVGLSTASAERMRIDSSGNVLIGNTSAAAYSNGYFILPNLFTSLGHPNGTITGTAYALFGYNGSGIGSITQNGTTAVAYNTTSDYRLKENVATISNAISTIQTLNPVTFDWIADKSNDVGFLAHEFQSVIPRAVTGEKDAVDAEGKPVYQQMDNSSAVPYLVKAIQEQQTIINDLKARITALEGAK
jgi:hypothetical protein